MADSMNSTGRSLQSVGSLGCRRTHCYCGYELVVKVSTTSTNPGRRFIGCPNYQDPSKCGFFQWIDGPIDEGIKVLLAKQEKKMKALEAEVGRMEAHIGRLDAHIIKMEADFERLEANYLKSKKFRMFLLICFVATMIPLILGRD